MNKQPTYGDLINPQPDTTRGGPYIGQQEIALMYTDGAIRSGPWEPNTNPALMAENRHPLSWPWWDNTPLENWQLLPHLHKP